MTALGINAQGVAVESYHRQVQELTDVIVRHLPRFHRMALRLLGNIADAEDAVQDALLSALTHLDQFRAEAKMSTWLTAIRDQFRTHEVTSTFNAGANCFRRNNGEQNLLLAEVLADHRPSPEDVCRRRELAERLAHATTQLSPILRRTFQLSELNGLSIRETAHLLGVPGGTVKARLARARVRLKKMVKKSLRRKARCDLKYGG